MNNWKESWAAYQQWAEAHTEPDPRSPQDIMRDIDWLYRSYSEEVRSTDPDPEKLGIQNLHRIFALYDQQLKQR